MRIGCDGGRLSPARHGVLSVGAARSDRAGGATHHCDAKMPLGRGASFLQLVGMSIALDPPTGRRCLLRLCSLHLHAATNAAAPAARGRLERGRLRDRAFFWRQICVLGILRTRNFALPN